jgi:hypothetical protein
MKSTAIVISLCALLLSSPFMASAQVGPTCCRPQLEDLISGFSDAAQRATGPILSGETERDYAVRYNQSYLSILTKQDWSVLSALSALPDSELCNGACSGSRNLRQILQAAITDKTATDGDRWNWKMFIVSILGSIIGTLGAMAGFLALRR